MPFLNHPNGEHLPNLNPSDGVNQIPRFLAGAQNRLNQPDPPAQTKESTSSPETKEAEAPLITTILIEKKNPKSKSLNLVLKM